MRSCLFSLNMYGFCPWVWSGRGQRLQVRVVEFKNDTTRPDQRIVLVFILILYLFIGHVCTLFLRPFAYNGLISPLQYQQFQ